jgi:hypothetical protein
VRFGDKIMRHFHLKRARTQNRIPLLLVALASSLSISQAGDKRAFDPKGRSKALPLPFRPPTSTASHQFC